MIDVTTKGVVRREAEARDGESVCASGRRARRGGMRWRGAAAAAVNVPLESADGAAIPATSSSLFWDSGSFSLLLLLRRRPARRRSRGAGHDAPCLATTVGESSLSSVKSSIRFQPLDGCAAGSTAHMPLCLKSRLDPRHEITLCNAMATHTGGHS